MMVNVYIPGLGQRMDRCVKYVDSFKKHGKELLIVDMEKLTLGKNFSLDSVFSEIERLSDGEKIEYLVGYSMGGAIAIDYTDKNPGKVDKLILIDPLVTKITNFPMAFRKLMSDDKDAVRKGLKAESKYKINMFFKPDFVNFMLKEARIIPQIKTLGNSFKIDNKTFFLWAKDDLLCPVVGYDNVKGYFSDKELILIEEGGHQWALETEKLDHYIGMILEKY